MISKTSSRKPIAACLAVAILSVYSMVVLASPAAKAPSGELSVSGQVTINGENVVSGTVFSDSLIATAEKSSATVNLSKMGSVQLAPNSGLKLSFTDKAVSGLLENGSANVSTLAGNSVSFVTKDGMVVVDGSQTTSFTVKVVNGVTSLTTHSGVAELRNTAGSVKHVAAGESATTTQGGSGDDDDDLTSGETFALVALGAGAIAAILWATLHDNDVNFGGNAVVVSPAK
jgi:hypothetical protein